MSKSKINGRGPKQWIDGTRRTIADPAKKVCFPNLHVIPWAPHVPKPPSAFDEDLTFPLPHSSPKSRLPDPYSSLLAPLPSSTYTPTILAVRSRTNPRARPGAREHAPSGALDLTRVLMF